MPDLLSSWLTPLALAFLGACVGSFLNVAIYRTPLGLSISDPARSFCPKCKKQIPWYLNIPVLSWLMLRGKCAQCKSGISVRYWIVEVLTAGLFLAVALEYDHAATYTQLFICIWVAFAILISFIDAETMLVFPKHTLIGAAAGLITAVTYPLMVNALSFEWTEALSYSLIGGATGFFGIYIIIELGRLLMGSWKKEYEERTSWALREPSNEQEELQLILPDRTYGWSDLFSRKGDKAIFTDVTLTVDKTPIHTNRFFLYEDKIETEEGRVFSISDISSAEGTVVSIKANREVMGMGDAWIMMMIGTLTGWQGCLFSLVCGSFIGLLFALFGKIGMNRQIPFGPCLLIASVFWLLGGSYFWWKYLEWAIPN